MILTAALLPGSETPAGDGSTGALRCTLVLPDASRRAAILKRGALGEVAAEVFSAVLLRAGAVGQVLALNRDAIAQAARALPDPLGADALARIVSERVGSVAAALLARFPAPDDLISASS